MTVELTGAWSLDKLTHEIDHQGVFECGVVGTGVRGGADTGEKELQ